MEYWIAFLALAVLVFSGCVEEEKPQERISCDSFQDAAEKNWCYYGEAVSEKDPSFCERITEQELRETCFKDAV